MTKKDFIGLLDRYLQENTTPEEAQLFDRFVKKMAEQPPGWELGDRERIKLEIYANIKRQIQVPQARIIRLPMWVRVAASIAIVLTVSVFLIWRAPSNEVTIATTNGERDTILLADGSRIFLNVASQITFSKSFNKRKREVNLIGEAFFEVAKNPKRPFIVHCSDVNTTVLGTSFNIKAFDEEPTVVTVATGKVQVAIPKYPNQKPLILTPNQQAIYDAKTRQLTRRRGVIAANFIAWKEGFLQFDNTPMQEAIVTLEKWYDVNITLKNPALAKCKISGKFPGDNLKNVLEIIQFITSIHYQFENNKQVALSGKACGVQ